MEGLGNYSGIIMIVLLFAVFYFFLIRPGFRYRHGI